MTDRSVERHLPRDFVEEPGAARIVGSGADITAAIMDEPEFDPTTMEA